jgi:hypothetical protein
MNASRLHLAAMAAAMAAALAALVPEPGQRHERRMPDRPDIIAQRKKEKRRKKIAALPHAGEIADDR